MRRASQSIWGIRQLEQEEQLQKRHGHGSLKTPNRSCYANCMTTPTATLHNPTQTKPPTAEAGDARAALRKKAPKSSPNPTTQGRLEASGSMPKFPTNGKPQPTSKQPGEPCRNHKSPEEITLFALDLGTDCVSLIGSEVESASQTLPCVTTSRHEQRRETAMTDTQFIYSFIIGWVSCWLWLKMMANR